MRRPVLGLVAFGYAACWAVPRRWVMLAPAPLVNLPRATWAEEVSGPVGPGEEDVAMMQNALSSVRRIGDFPSKVRGLRMGNLHKWHREMAWEMAQ